MKYQLIEDIHQPPIKGIDDEQVQSKQRSGTTSRETTS